MSESTILSHNPDKSINDRISELSMKRINGKGFHNYLLSDPIGNLYPETRISSLICPADCMPAHICPSVYKFISASYLNLANINLKDLFCNYFPWNILANVRLYVV